MLMAGNKIEAPEKQKKKLHRRDNGNSPTMKALDLLLEEASPFCQLETEYPEQGPLRQVLRRHLEAGESSGDTRGVICMNCEVHK